MKLLINRAMTTAARLLGVVILSLISVTVAAESSTYIVDKPVEMNTLDGSIVVLPNTDFNNDGVAQSGGISIRSSVIDDRRLYEVHYKGNKHTASIPLESPTLRLVFNPKKRMFDQMLSSVRVELKDYQQLDEVVKSVGGTGGKAYPQLGYAVIGLKKDTHPVEAVELLQSMTDVEAAEIRLKGPPKRFW